MLTLLRTHASLRLLFVGQALYWSCSIIGIALTALVGARLAPQPWLATLPLALLVAGNLAAVRPLAAAMQRHGRRRVLVAGALVGVAGGLLACAAIVADSFPLFGLGIAGVGVYQASSAYYRYAALETVAPEWRGRAAACVLAGGVCAALLAPSLALAARQWLITPFAGAYLAIAGLAAAAALLLSRLPRDHAAFPATPTGAQAGLAATRRAGAPTPPAAATPAPAATAASPASTTPWRTLLARPTLRAAIVMTAVGHGLMILVMNATPLAMADCGFAVETSARVIQWHVLGMFLPSFFAGTLVDRHGSRRVAAAGIAVLAASAVLALSGVAMAQFLASSLLLGIGWSLLIVAGTTLLTAAHAPDERAGAQSLMEFANGATAAAMSFASGALQSGVGWHAINGAMLPLLALAAWLLWSTRAPRLRAA
ncbi:MFS transporter [uncultured Pseudacidovorax sp.]|uniref:MFS transporter n=1 Tax=uncultured Pseudacidovorax sp. TaxID=679313 RepID=UPI0025FDBE1F|nr:MFS transporter [uncultured Pseudacidovorax sp.]